MVETSHREPKQLSDDVPHSTLIGELRKMKASLAITVLVAVTFVTFSHIKPVQFGKGQCGMSI